MADICNDKYKEIVETLHSNVHAIRMIKGYKPSEMDIRTAKLISELYKDKCKDCDEAALRMKYAPSQPQEQGFLNKLFGGS